jgi:hypothetical protein
MAHSATLPTVTPKPRRKTCPHWCAANHNEQRASGLAPFHVSPHVRTPIGWAYLTQDPGQDPVIVQDVIPTDVPRDTMTFKEATETITALTELIGMTL